MSKVGVMMTADRADQPMSAHFGKAEWMMVADTENQAVEFVKNDVSNGRGAAEIAVRQGCTDMIVSDIGDGALRHLQTARIRAWAVPRIVAGSEALQMFKEGQLTDVPPARAAEGHGGGHGCCCANRRGSEATTCCGS